MEDDARRYWEAFEAETGERVEAKAMGQWFEKEGATEGLWGILVLTDKSVRFRHMPSENWFSSLLRGRGPNAKARGPIELVVPRESLLAVETERRRLFGALFGPAWPRFRLAWNEGGATKDAIFSIDNQQRLIEALTKALPVGAA